MLKKNKTSKFRVWSGVGLISFFIFLAACALPIRPTFKVDESLPLGNFQGNTFIGQRFPFKVQVPPGWQGTTQYPEFLVEQGYGREGLQATPFFLFNPQTKSSIQFDFSPAGRTARFNQEIIESITRSAGQSLLSEVHQEHDNTTRVQLSKVTAIKLEGVPYAARMSAQYKIKGEWREQGWIYAFAEPFQIFILYLIVGENNTVDREALEQALSSFAYLGVR